ncbi:cytohesin-interacting protein-like [Arapaima gigas]
MNLCRRNSQESYFLESSLSTRSRSWQRRSLNDPCNTKHLQNIATTFATLPRGRNPVAYSRSNSLVDFSDAIRTTIVLEKQDNETFGFEIQTYGLRVENSTQMEMCTFVCSVQQDSSAERAGLNTGDVIVTVNGVCTEGSAHQYIVDLIRKSTNILKLETVSGAVVKRIEMERKLKQLKQSLREKWVEFRTLAKRERQLSGGNLNNCSSPSSPTIWDGLRFSSDSSCRSVMTEESEDFGVFEDPHSPMDDGCFFPSDFPPRGASVSRSRSISLGSGGSSGPTSPSWDLPDTSSAFGTMPRRARHGSVRKRILKFIPGLHRSVEEEETS